MTPTTQATTTEQLYRVYIKAPPEKVWEAITRPEWTDRLTVTHQLQGAPQTAAVVAGEMEDQGAGGGWNEVLSGLKTLLETGKPLRG
jgi:hypothetical protein